jgi:glycosyltransferase involved in cell wall biosynthesis
MTHGGECTATEDRRLRGISFIVPIRNGEKVISRTIETLLALPLHDCEIIVVDSGSTDRTADIVREHAATCPYLALFRIEGFSNSAMARNVGIDNATKDCLFFLDGDVEVSEAFARRGCDMLRKGTAGTVAGRLREYVYDKDYNAILSRVDDRHHIADDRIGYFSGGIFMTTASLVRRVGRFDERMERNQDIDFTMRLSGVAPLFLIAENMGIHHTVGYEARIIPFIRKGTPFFFGTIIRKNMLRPRALHSLLRKNRGFVFGWCAWALILFSALLCFNGAPWSVFAPLPLVPFIYDVFMARKNRSQLKHTLLSHYIYAPLVCVGFLYCPKSHGGISSVIRVA